jgi:predicted SAM-dependent methyltransferase
LPRKFSSVEVLTEEPPFDAELLGRLGLHGIHCGSALKLLPGCVNTDRLEPRDQQGVETQPGRLARMDGELYYLPHDAVEPYPFRDRSFEWAYCEHFIEHLTLEEAVAWLAEVRRLLKPGGLLRLSTPDLALYAAGYMDPAGEMFATHRERLGTLRMFAGQEVPGRRAWMLNQIFFMWHHRWIFDLDEVRYAAGLAGWDPERVVQWSFREGSDPEVAGFDLPIRRHESLYVELRA